MKICVFHPTLPGKTIQNDPSMPRCPGMIKKFSDRIYPVGSLILSQIFMDNGHDVVFYDESVNSQSIKDYFRQEFFNWIFINCSQNTFEHEIRIAQYIKHIHPTSIIFALGVFPSNCPINYLNEGFDFIIEGEPEFVIIDLLKLLDLDSDLSSQIIQNKIKSVYWMENNKLINYGSRILGNDLDNLPFPAISLINLHQYTLPYAHSDLLYLLLTSRGCNHQCTFCTTPKYFGRKVRFRSIRNCIDEIVWAKKEHGISEFHIQDDSFLISPKRAKEFAQNLIQLQKEGSYFQWSCAARVDQIIDLELIHLLEQSGLYLIKFGIESTHPVILSQIKKHITEKQIKYALKLLKKTRIDTLAYFMLGFPGDNIHSLLKTIRDSLHLGASMILFNKVYPWVGSELSSQITPISNKSCDINRLPEIIHPQTSPKLFQILFLLAYFLSFLRPSFLAYQIKALSGKKSIISLLKTFVEFIGGIVH